MNTTEQEETIKQDEIAEIVNEHNHEIERVYEGTMRHIDESSLEPNEKAALKKRFEQPKGIAMPALIGIKKERPATIEMAAEIFSSNFLGNEAMLQFLKKINVVDHQGRDLPYRVGFLELMAESGAIMTCQPLFENTKNIGINEFPIICSGLSQKGGGKLLHIEQFQWQEDKDAKVLTSAWFAKEKYDVYRDSQIIHGGAYRIATKNPILGTANEKFVQQMMMVCEWLEKLHKNFPMSPKFKKTIDQLRAGEKHLIQLQDTDGKKFLQEIQKYDFWNLCMETGLETLLRRVIYNQVTGGTILEGTGARNCVPEPVDGYVGSCVEWNSGGPRLGWY